MPPTRRTLRDRDKTLLDMVFGFKENVPLKGFMQETTNRMEETFTLAEILETIKNYISVRRLFDENNPSIIMCSEVLETVFNQKALHVLQVRESVLNQLIPIGPREDEDKRRNERNQENQLIRTTTISISRTTEETREDTRSYELKLPLREVFQTMEEFDQTKMIFAYNEITALLSSYILKHRSRLFDKRNIKVALVEKDLLGVAFRVKAFHRCQVHTLLNTQLMPVHPRLIPVDPMTPTHPILATITSDCDHDITISMTRLRYMDIQDEDEEEKNN